VKAAHLVISPSVAVDIPFTHANWYAGDKEAPIVITITLEHLTTAAKAL
jgi:hypothetical protein